MNELKDLLISRMSDIKLLMENKSAKVAQLM